VSKRTVERLEAGAVGTQLSGFIRICRTLGLLDRFEALAPAPAPSPIDLLKLHGKRRRRATGTRAGTAGGKPWTWGEPA
jgi:hypothetical protein